MSQHRVIGITRNKYTTKKNLITTKKISNHIRYQKYLQFESPRPHHPMSDPITFERVCNTNSVHWCTASATTGVRRISLTSFNPPRRRQHAEVYVRLNRPTMFCSRMHESGSPPKSNRFFLTTRPACPENFIKIRLVPALKSWRPLEASERPLLGA